VHARVNSSALNWPNCAHSR